MSFDGDISFWADGELIVERERLPLGRFVADLSWWLERGAAPGDGFLWEGTSFDCGHLSQERDGYTWRLRMLSEELAVLGDCRIGGRELREGLQRFARRARTEIQGFWEIDVLNPPAPG